MIPRPTLLVPLLVVLGTSIPAFGIALPPVPESPSSLPGPVRDGDAANPASTGASPPRAPTPLLPRPSPAPSLASNPPTAAAATADDSGATETDAVLEGVSTWFGPHLVGRIESLGRLTESMAPARLFANPELLRASAALEARLAVEAAASLRPARTLEDLGLGCADALASATGPSSDGRAPPDLEAFVWRDPGARPGDPVRFHAAVLNKGPGIAGGFEVSFRLADPAGAGATTALGRFQVPCLPPAAESAAAPDLVLIQSDPWAAQAGVHLVEVAADADGATGDDRPANNRAELTFGVERPDLGLRDLRAGARCPEAGRVGRPMCLAVTVTNTGDAPAGGFWIAFEEIAGPARDRAWVPGLAAGEAVTVESVAWNADAAALRWFRVEADVGGAPGVGLVREIREGPTQNAIAGTLTVA